MNLFFRVGTTRVLYDDYGKAIKQVDETLKVNTIAIPRTIVYEGEEINCCGYISKEVLAVATADGLKELITRMPIYIPNYTEQADRYLEADYIKSISCNEVAIYMNSFAPGEIEKYRTGICSLAKKNEEPQIKR